VLGTPGGPYRYCPDAARRGHRLIARGANMTFNLDSNRIKYFTSRLLCRLGKQQHKGVIANARGDINIGQCTHHNVGEFRHDFIAGRQAYGFTYLPEVL